MRLWLLRAVWLVLPLAAGPAASDALATWSDAPRIVAAVLLWLAWGIGVVATLAPRPIGLTAIRIVAPAFVVVAVVVAETGHATDLASAFAVAVTLLAAVLVADPQLAIAAVNGIAYGDELRHPLRTPPGLYLAPVPLARAAVVVGTAAGPLLLADGAVVGGLVALVVGVPVAVLAARALHVLARRWIVLVPAGVVLVDSMTIADPVLFVRRHVRALRAARGDTPIPDGTLDLRLGATWGSLALHLDAEADLVRTPRRGRPGETLQPDSILVAVAARDVWLAEAAERRLRVTFA